MSNATYGRLKITALGWGLSAALAVMFVICLVVALVAPNWSASHAWIGIFSAAPMTSIRVWLDGLVFSLAFGWSSAIVLATVYNRLVRSR